MAGNSQRKGAIKKTGKGNPTAGSGGRVRRGLEGKGPTPKAKDRPNHKVYKQRQKVDKAAAARPKRRTTGSTDAEWMAGRNSVVEVLREGVPVTGVYVAEGAERDGRLREVFKLAAERGICAGRGQPHRDGPADRRRRAPGPRRAAAVLRVRPPRRPARPGRRARRAAADRGPRLRHRPAQPRRRGALRGRLRRARRADPRAPGRRHDRRGLEDLRRGGRPGAGRADGQPDPPAQGLPGRRAAW